MARTVVGLILMVAALLFSGYFITNALGVAVYGDALSEIEVTPEQVRSGFISSLSLAGFGFVVFAIAVRWLRRQARLNLAATVDRDERNPVLFLRPFSLDRARLRAHASRRQSIFDRIGLQRSDRLEEIVTWRLWRRGPVVAIGAPGMRAPSLGAAREYYDDQTWQQAVQYYLDRTGLVAVVVGDTPNVAWEILEVIEAGRQRDCIFVIPQGSADQARQRLAELGTLLGMPVPTVESGQALAVAFGNDGRPVLIAGDSGDDLSYESAIDAAIALVEERPQLDPLAEVDGSVEANVKPASASVPVHSFPKAWAVLGLALLVWSFKGFVVIPLDDNNESQYPQAYFGTGRALYDIESLSGSVVVSEPLDNSVSVYSLLDGSRTVSFPVGERPKDLALDSDGRLVVSNRWSDDVAIVNLNELTIDRVAVGDAPVGVAVEGHMAYVAVAGEGAIVAVDTRTSTITDRLVVGGMPWGIASYDGAVVATDAESGELLWISTEVLSVERRVAVGRGPTDVLILGGRVFVTLPAAGEVRSFDLTTGEPLDRLDLGGAPGFVTAYGDQIVLSQQSVGTIAVMDQSLERSSVVRYGAPGFPAGVGVDEVQILVVLRRDGAVGMVDG